MLNFYYYSDDYQCLLMKVLAYSNEENTKIISVDEFEKQLFESLKKKDVFGFFNSFSDDKTLVITSADNLIGRHTAQLLLKEVLSKRLSLDCGDTYIFSSIHPNYIDNIALKGFVLNNFKSIYLIDRN